MRFLTEINTFMTIAKIYLSRQMTYRLNFLMPYILRIFQLTASIVVWHALFKQQESINGYTFNKMVSYLLFSQFSLLVFYPSHIFALQELVRKGTLNAHLLRPCNYMLNSSGQFFSMKSFHLLFFFIIFCFSFFQNGLNFHILYQGIPIFFMSLSLAFFFGFYLSCFAFYIVEMWPMKNLFIAGMAILGGTVVPLDLLPNYISSWAPYTPFAYFSYVNVKILQGEMSQALMNIHLLNLLSLNILFWGLAHLTFKNGLRKYEGVGC